MALFSDAFLRNESHSKTINEKIDLLTFENISSKLKQ